MMIRANYREEIGLRKHYYKSYKIGHCEGLNPSSPVV